MQSLKNEHEYTSNPSKLLNTLRYYPYTLEYFPLGRCNHVKHPKSYNFLQILSQTSLFLPISLGSSTLRASINVLFNDGKEGIRE